MKKYILKLFIICYLCSSPLESTTLHSFIVCDTKDEVIGSSSMLDLVEAKGQLEWISLRTGLKSHQQLFYGETFDSFKLMESLYSLEVEEDDVIFFYYSGHGFRTRETLGALPVMEFYDDQFSIDTGHIVQLLEQKGARMVLVLADACNSWTPLAYAPDVYPLKASGIDIRLRKRLQIEKKNLRRLFCQFRGSIEISSSLPKKKALAYANKGGAYSQSFWKELSKATYSKTPASWFEILDNVETQLLREHNQPTFFNIVESSE